MSSEAGAGSYGGFGGGGYSQSGGYGQDSYAGGSGYSSSQGGASSSSYDPYAAGNYSSPPPTDHYATPGFSDSRPGNSRSTTTASRPSTSSSSGGYDKFDEKIKNYVSDSDSDSDEIPESVTAAAHSARPRAPSGGQNDLAAPPSRATAKSSGVDLLGLGESSSPAPASTDLFGAPSQTSASTGAAAPAPAGGDMSWGAFSSAQTSSSSSSQDFFSQGSQPTSAQAPPQQPTGPQTLNMMSGHANTSQVRRTPAAPKPVLSESEVGLNHPLLSAPRETHFLSLFLSLSLVEGSLEEGSQLDQS